MTRYIVLSHGCSCTRENKINHKTASVQAISKLIIRGLPGSVLHAFNDDGEDTEKNRKVFCEKSDAGISYKGYELIDNFVEKIYGSEHKKDPDRIKKAYKFFKKHGTRISVYSTHTKNEEFIDKYLYFPIKIWRCDGQDLVDLHEKVIDREATFTKEFSTSFTSNDHHINLSEFINSQGMFEDGDTVEVLSCYCGKPINYDSESLVETDVTDYVNRVIEVSNSIPEACDMEIKRAIPLAIMQSYIGAWTSDRVNWEKEDNIDTFVNNVMKRKGLRSLRKCIETDRVKTLIRDEVEKFINRRFKVKDRNHCFYYQYLPTEKNDRERLMNAFSNYITYDLNLIRDYMYTVNGRSDNEFNEKRSEIETFLYEMAFEAYETISITVARLYESESGGDITKYTNDDVKEKVEKASKIMFGKSDLLDIIIELLPACMTKRSSSKYGGRKQYRITRSSIWIVSLIAVASAFAGN